MDDPGDTGVDEGLHSVVVQRFVLAVVVARVLKHQLQNEGGKCLMSTAAFSVAALEKTTYLRSKTWNFENVFESLPELFLEPTPL